MNLESLKTVADNLQRYMEANGLEQKDVAKKTGVPRRTVNHVLQAKPDSNTTLKTVEMIADGLGIAIWHLLVPNLAVELMKNKALDKLIDNYSAAEPEGRSYIERVSTKEAGYRDPTPGNEETDQRQRFRGGMR